MEETQQKYDTRDLISRISTLERPSEYLTENEERNYTTEKFYDGIIKLKEKLLGKSNKGSKTLDEIAKALFELKIVSSLNEAKDIVPNLINTHLTYESPQNPNKWTELSFSIEKNTSEDVRYRVVNTFHES